MSMQYPRPFIPEEAVPRARVPLLQHLVDTYASETNKTAAVWSELTDDSSSSGLTPAAARCGIPRAPAPLRAAVLRRVHRASRARSHASAPSRLRAGVGKIHPIGMTRSGSLFYVSHRGTENVFLADLDAGTKKVGVRWCAFRIILPVRIEDQRGRRTANSSH